MRALAAIGLLAIALCAEPATAATPTVIADGAGAANLSGSRGELVWSVRDPATKRWRLVRLTPEGVVPLTVPTRAIPFDADVGPDRAGHPVVVYSRCETDPTTSDAWLTGRGCRIMRLRLDVPDVPHAVRGTSTPGWSATTPSQWRGSLAFVRHRDRAYSSQIRLLRPGARRSIALRGMPVACEIDCDDRRILTTVESLDLGPRAAAFIWRQDGGDTVGISSEWWLRADDLRSRRVVTLSDGFIDGACGYVMPLSPTATGFGATWIASGSPCDDTETVIGRVDKTRPGRRVLEDPAGLMTSATTDGNTVTWLRANPTPTGGFSCQDPAAHCVIVQTRKPDWRSLGPREPLGPVPEDAR